jgi:hypothetical protein
MPEAGRYLLTNIGFSADETPVLTLQQNGVFSHLAPLGTELTLRIDPVERFCVGWRDITKGEIFTCPDAQNVESKYEQCSACQNRTGFNPAFYNASSVSSQQEARNNEPHILYLARFGQEVIKVGISYAQRGISRLLEQGARDAIILDTFPTAHIARQYEAKIAAMPGIIETLQLRKKLSLLESPYDHGEGERELLAAKQRIEEALKVTFTGSEVIDLDPLFFPDGTPNLTDSFSTYEQNAISGKVIGSLGSLLFCHYNDTPVYLPLKKYVGYYVELSHGQSDLQLPARQASLF